MPSNCIHSNAKTSRILRNQRHLTNCSVGIAPSISRFLCISSPSISRSKQTKSVPGTLISNESSRPGSIKVPGSPLQPFSLQFLYQPITACFPAGSSCTLLLFATTTAAEAPSFDDSLGCSACRSASSLSARRFRKLRYVCQPTAMTPPNMLRYSKGTKAKLKAVTAGQSLHELTKLTGTVLQTRRQASAGVSPDRSALE